MSDAKKPLEFHELEALFHKMHTEEGKLRRIYSKETVDGRKVYYMERPKLRTPSEPECKLHEYERFIGFSHDYEQCKHCKGKK